MRYGHTLVRLELNIDESVGHAQSWTAVFRVNGRLKVLTTDLENCCGDFIYSSAISGAD